VRARTALAALLFPFAIGCSSEQVDGGAGGAGGTGGSAEAGGSGPGAAAGAAGAGGAGAGDAGPPPLITSPPEATDLDADPGVVHVRLRAGAAVHQVGEHAFEGYAFNGITPGPTIRARVGDTIVADLENELDEGTTVHWHGVRVPNAMDGVPSVTDPVSAHGKFTYSFVVDRPGTFWYHPHVDSHRQVDLGLYGLLVVDDPAEPPADAELLLVFDAWDEARGDGGDAGVGAQDKLEGHAHGGALPVLWSVNGVLGGEVRPRGGQRVRVRMLNASITGYLTLTWPGLRQIGSDQGLLPELAQPGSIELAPGDRAEAEWLIGDQPFAVVSLPYSLSGGPAVGAALPLFTVTPEAPAPPPAPIAWPFPGGTPTPDPPYTDIVYVFSGSDEGGQWLINGEAFPDVTVSELAVGAEAVIEIRNISSTEHPFHLHGHSFEVLSVDGAPPPRLTIEDTFNVRIGQAVRLRLVADNPGDWMAHCHILPHAHGGMMTVLRVK
jgi:FtsP/CotA-like multicopper oxidase with cupredoxin domain